MARSRRNPRAGVRHPGPAPSPPPRGLSVPDGPVLLAVQRLYRPAQPVHRYPELRQALGERRLPADLPERLRVHGHRRALQGGAGHRAGPPPQPAALVQATDPRGGPPALGHPHRAQHPRLVVDVQLALQRGELDGHRARDHGPAGSQLARAEALRDGRRHRGQHLARPALLRHHHPRRPRGHPARAVRGGGGRRGGSQRPLLAHHLAAPEAGPRRGRTLLHHFHLQRLQHRVRAHAGGAGEFHASVRHPLARGGHRHRAHRGRGGHLALSLPDPGLRGVGAAALRAQAGLLMAVARRPLFRKTLLHVGLVPFLLFALFPFYHMTLTSLKQDRELYDRHAVPLIIRQGPTLEHYAKLLQETEFLTWTKNSLLVTALATGASLLIGTVAAYALARLKFFGVGSFGTGIFVTYLVPFCTWLLMGYFRTVPKEVEECAMVDGATRIQALWRIVLPIAVPGLVC